MPNSGRNVVGIVSTGLGPGSVSDHRTLEHRDAKNQHPISAITNLEEILNGKADIGDAAVSTQEVIDSKVYNVLWLNKPTATNETYGFARVPSETPDEPDVLKAVYSNCNHKSFIEFEIPTITEAEIEDLFDDSNN